MGICCRRDKLVIRNKSECDKNGDGSSSSEMDTVTTASVRVQFMRHPSPPHRDAVSCELWDCEKKKSERDSPVTMKGLLRFCCCFFCTVLHNAQSPHTRLTADQRKITYCPQHIDTVWPTENMVCASERQWQMRINLNRCIKLINLREGASDKAPAAWQYRRWRCVVGKYGCFAGAEGGIKYVCSAYRIKINCDERENWRARARKKVQP